MRESVMMDDKDTFDSPTFDSRTVSRYDLWTIAKHGDQSVRRKFYRESHAGEINSDGDQGGAIMSSPAVRGQWWGRAKVDRSKTMGRSGARRTFRKPWKYLQAVRWYTPAGTELVWTAYVCAQQTSRHAFGEDYATQKLCVPAYIAGLFRDDHVQEQVSQLRAHAIETS
ncbi:hypothetical protein B0O80DRAFT_430714 [Mortierella sp. GBAus27b]|nr:hypothetical protein B0O80DRAFT_430714 [Mortierella sp. GBAus27b]